MNECSIFLFILIIYLLIFFQVMQITLAQQIEGSINFKLSFKTSDSLGEVRPVIFSLGTKHLILEYTWPLYRSICVCKCMTGV